MDIRGLIERMNRDQRFINAINNPRVQFGTPAKPYLGLRSLLPEKPVRQNQYSETDIRYRSVIANAGTRYSPIQRKRSMLVGSFDVKLGHSDIGDEFTGSDYDAFVQLLESRGQNTPPNIQDMFTLINWFDNVVTIPLVEHNEKNLWDAIVSSQVTLKGDNGYLETVSLLNPAGHRVNAAGVWSDNTYDPWDDIVAQARVLRSKGFTVNRAIAGANVVPILTGNLKVRQRMGILSITGGMLTGLPANASVEDVNAALRRERLPEIEEYTSQYYTQNGSGYFLDPNSLVLVASTGRDESLDLGDSAPVVIPNTLGYTAIGVPSGQTTSGRRSFVASYDDKPPRVDAQGWQASFPVITEPEAIAVIKNIS
jgi:hypothetical protein